MGKKEPNAIATLARQPNLTKLGGAATSASTKKSDGKMQKMERMEIMESM